MNSHQSILLAALCTITVCAAHIGGGQTLQDVNPQVYCGRALARALALLCFDDGGPESKRSEAGSMYNTILSTYYKDPESQYRLPWIAPHKARGMSLPSRGKRFVVNECCDKPCSISELLSYC